MIREKVPEDRLFYLSDELYRPSRRNFFVRLNEAVGDWKTLCAPLRSAFCQDRNGRPVDPVVYFKIFLVGYLENIVFDTDLAERIADSLSIREFLGYGPCEPTPDHSSIGRVRAKFADCGSLVEVFDSVVALCARQGLVGGEQTAVDSTLLPANASLSSLECVKTKMSVRDHLKKAREAGAKPSVSNSEFRSTSDPDARIAKKGTTCPRGMYHKATTVVDSKSQVILAAHVCTADVNDATAALPALEHAQKVLESNSLKLSVVVADSGYDECNFHAFVEDLGALPITNYKNTSSQKPEGFTKESFTYDAERDVYICPNGAVLTPGKPTENDTRYQSRPKDCAGCPLRAHCLGPKADKRSISRHRNENARLRNIERCHTDEGRAALKNRKIVAEPPYAHMKCHGGLSRVSCTGTGNADVKAKMAGLAWNLLKLLKKLSMDLYGLLFWLDSNLKMALSRWTRPSRSLFCNVLQ